MIIQLNVICTQMVDFRRPGHICRNFHVYHFDAYSLYHFDAFVIHMHLRTRCVCNITYTVLTCSYLVSMYD